MPRCGDVSGAHPIARQMSLTRRCPYSATRQLGDVPWTGRAMLRHAANALKLPDRVAAEMKRKLAPVARVCHIIFNLIRVDWLAAPAAGVTRSVASVDSIR